MLRKFIVRPSLVDEKTMRKQIEEHRYKVRIQLVNSFSVPPELNTGYTAPTRHTRHRLHVTADVQPSDGRVFVKMFINAAESALSLAQAEEVADRA